MTVSAAAITPYKFKKKTLSGRHSVKVLSTTFDHSLVATVIDLYRHLTFDSRGARHTESNYK